MAFQMSMSWNAISPDQVMKGDESCSPTSGDSDVPYYSLTPCRILLCGTIHGPDMNFESGRYGEGCLLLSQIMTPSSTASRSPRCLWEFLCNSTLIFRSFCLQIVSCAPVMNAQDQFPCVFDYRAHDLKGKYHLVCKGWNMTDLRPNHLVCQD